MTTRWCIFSSPRSGSTLLEEKISNHIKKLNPGISPLILGEFLHWDWYTHYDNTDHYVTGHSPFYSDIRKKNRDIILNIITTQNNSITMRIFPQHWHKEYINLNDFCGTLQENNFKFLYLRRNFKDRLISLCVAQKTNNWHRFSDKIAMPKNNKVTIDLELLGKNYYEIRMTDFYLERLMKIFPGEIINYESFDIDCKNIGILETNCRNKKLYNIDYSNLINNFAEVNQFISEF
jgi:hypothetical protein